jgi:hypothetical protein
VRPGDPGWIEPEDQQRRVVVLVCRSQGCTCHPDIHLVAAPGSFMARLLGDSHDVKQPCVHHDDNCRLLRARHARLN